MAGEEPQKGPALLRAVVADGPAQHRVAGLKRVEDRALRDRALDAELHLALNLREGAQVLGEYDADHIGVIFSA